MKLEVTISSRDLRKSSKKEAMLNSTCMVVNVTTIWDSMRKRWLTMKLPRIRPQTISLQVWFATIRDWLMQVWWNIKMLLMIRKKPSLCSIHRRFTRQNSSSVWPSVESPILCQKRLNPRTVKRMANLQTFKRMARSLELHSWIAPSRICVLHACRCPQSQHITTISVYHTLRRKSSSQHWAPTKRLFVLKQKNLKMKKESDLGKISLFITRIWVWLSITRVTCRELSKNTKKLLNIMTLMQTTTSTEVTYASTRRTSSWLTKISRVPYKERTEMQSSIMRKDWLTRRKLRRLPGHPSLTSI